MTIHDLVTHYQNFLESHQWLANGLSWTVVEPAKPSTDPLRTVAAKLTGGGSPEIARDLNIRETDLYPVQALFAGTSGSHVVLLEKGGAYVSSPEVLAWLSDGARVWNVGWHIHGGERLTYAVDGEILASVHELNPRQMTGTAPDSIAEELTPLRDAASVDLSRASALTEAWVRKTTAMGIVEQVTDVRLDAAWLARSRTAILIDPPLSVPLEPLGFGRADPALDARLRAAAEETRREVLLLLVRVLSERHDLDDDVIASALETIRAGGPLDDQQREDLLDMQLELNEGWQPVLDETASDPDRLRAAAGMAVRHALLEAGEHTAHFQAVTYTRRILGAEWPGLRAELERLTIR
jgi:hypothetical protein